MKKTSLMKKIYDSKAFWIILSLIASISLWIYVTGVDTEEQKRTFYGVRVELEGEDRLRDSRNLVITDLDTSTVTVELKGPRRVVGSLTSADLSAKIDVSNLSQPSYTTQQYRISYPDGIESGSIKEIRNSPDTVSFMVSKLISKPIQVRGAFEGSFSENRTAETPYFEPSTITISGAEAYLKNVDYAWVNFGKGVSVDSTYSVDTGFTLMTADDQPCSVENISFSADTVKATLPILEIKDVKLSVDVIEGAGADSTNTKIKIEPGTITLAGDSSILDGINRIVLDTIDLTEFTSSFTDSFVIPLDNELKNLTGVSEAKVTIEIANLETREFEVKNIEVKNAPDGMDVEIVTKSINVIVRGTDEELSKIKPGSIRAVVDLSDLKNVEGNHYSLNPKIFIGDSSAAGAIGKYEITVKIGKA